jgi:hypothetical protein
MPTWLSALVIAVNRVALPLAGAWGILTDRPLEPLPAAIYAVMMGLLPASVLERFVRPSTAAPAGTPPQAPPPTPSPTRPAQ